VPRQARGQQQDAEHTLKYNVKPVHARLPGEGVDLGRPAARGGGDRLVITPSMAE